MSFRRSIGLLLVSGAAVAQTSVPPVTVDYEAHGGCPERSVFVGNLLARTERARLVEDSPDATRFELSIVQSGQGSVGRLAVRRPGGERSVREVEAGSCDEVVEGLALVAALTIDPDAKTSSLTREAVAAAASSTTEGASDTGSSESATSTPETEPVPPDSAPVADDNEPPSAVPASEPQPRQEPAWRGLAVGFGVGGELHAAPLGEPQLGVRGFVDVASRQRGLFRPALGLSFARAARRYEGTLSDASLTWISGRLDFCPVDLVESERLALRPCAAVDVGVVQGEGESAAGFAGRDARFTWASGVALGRADYMPLGPLVLRLEAGVVVPFVPNASFELLGPQPETALDVPSVSYHFGVAVGLRLQ